MGMFLRTGKRYAVREAERARSAVPGARAGGPTCAKSRFPTPQSGPGGFWLAPRTRSGNEQYLS